MHRFWWISQTRGARREGFNAQCPSIPFDLNKTSLQAMTCQLPPTQSLTAALWLQRGQLMHFVSTTGRRAVRCARAYVQFLVRRSVLVSCYCKAVQNSAQHISITILKSGDPADREAVALRTVQKCITARFLVARQRLGGDVPEKNFLLKSVRINFGMAFFWASSRSTTKMWKSSLLQKKRWGVSH